MTYDKEFKEMWRSFEPQFGVEKHDGYAIWQAARKDHYRMGEKVEAKQIGAQMTPDNYINKIYYWHYIYGWVPYKQESNQ